MSTCIAESFAPQDLAKALERFEGDRELLRELASLVVREYPSLLTAMRAAAARYDAFSFERSAHSMKGMVANFQAEAATSAALALENMGRSGDLSRADAGMQLLEQELAALHRVFLAERLID
jgi:two-component system, sensor histidine kinase and response regulator